MREIGLQEFVDEIYEDRENDTKYIFFLGAGCSKSSGIPLAGELAEKWYEKLKKQKTKLNNFNKDNNIKDDKPDNFPNLYFKIFESLFPTPLSQQKEIQRITENITPSSGYYTLASLMQKSCFNSVITTNFDNLIQDALIYSGDKRALVITHQDLAKFIERNNTPLIVKVHGDSHMDPFNNTDNTKKIPDELNGAIQGLFINTKLVFIGYSGSDESIRDLLIGSKRIDHVYWLSSNLPSDNKLTEWWKDTSSKTFVKERDFDMIMGLIKSKFDLKKPNFELMATKLKKSYEESINEEIKEIITNKDKTEIDYLILGNNYFGKNEYQKAIESYQKAIKINSEYSSAYYNLGIVYPKIKEYSKSIESYEKAIELNLEDSNGYYNLGIVYTKIEQYEKAIESFNKALEFNPSNSSTYFNLGNLYKKIEQYERAIELYEKSIELDPKNSSAYNNLGVVLIEVKEYQKAIESYLNAIVINPEKKSSYINLFELEIIQNITLDKKYHKEYLSLIRNNNESSIIYDMLIVLKNIIEKNKYSTCEWEEKYRNKSMEDWCFNNLDDWVLKQKPDIKNKLLDVMKVFKSKLDKT